ncbi:MAG: hypothetical protein V3W41_22015 [Planctomycetota bacterium]
MAQTSRSIADLETLLATNGARGISGIDVRDLMESAMGCYGGLHIDGGSTALSLTATPAEVDTWLSSANLRNTTADLVNGRLQLDSDGIWRLDFSASFIVVTATDRFNWQLRADAVAIAGGQRDVTGVLAERASVHISQLYTAVAGAEISVYAAAVGAAGDATLEHANLVAHRVG